MIWVALIVAFLAGAEVMIAAAEYDRGGIDKARKCILWAVLDVCLVVMITLRAT